MLSSNQAMNEWIVGTERGIDGSRTVTVGRFVCCVGVYVITMQCYNRSSCSDTVHTHEARSNEETRER